METETIDLKIEEARILSTRKRHSDGRVKALRRCECISDNNR
jgi:hypothetical protein